MEQIYSEALSAVLSAMLWFAIFVGVGKAAARAIDRSREDQRRMRADNETFYNPPVRDRTMVEYE